MTQILSHEKYFLDTALASANKHFQEMSRLQGEEAGLGSDWHDNSGYESAVEETAKARGLRLKFSQAIDHAEIIQYPSPEDIEAKIGSLVLASDKWGKTPFVIVGQRLAGSEFYAEKWNDTNKVFEATEDMEVITPESMIGKAVLGAIAGQTVEYETPNGRTNALTIEQIDQSWTKIHFDRT